MPERVPPGPDLGGPLWKLGQPRTQSNRNELKPVWALHVGVLLLASIDDVGGSREAAAGEHSDVPLWASATAREHSDVPL